MLQYIVNFHSEAKRPAENLKFKRVEIMNKSKFLKKSLAAFLAILMVAAMIPMSAFAADAPTGVTTIRVNGVSAEWDGEKYVAAVSGTREEAANVPITAVTTGTTNVYVKEKDSEKVDPSTGLTLDLSKAANADKPATAGDDGTYVFTLLVGESINDPATYEQIGRASCRERV